MFTVSCGVYICFEKILSGVFKVLIPVELRKCDNNCFIIYIGKKLLCAPLLSNKYYRKCVKLLKTNKSVRLGKIKIRR
jgi:hypothetical protein